MAWTEETRSRARTAPRDPHKPGPFGRQKCGPSRTLQLTDKGRATVREYRRARIEAALGVPVLGWVDVPVSWLADAEVAP